MGFRAQARCDQMLFNEDPPGGQCGGWLSRGDERRGREASEEAGTTVQGRDDGAWTGLELCNTPADIWGKSIPDGGEKPKVSNTKISHYEVFKNARFKRII